VAKLIEIDGLWMRGAKRGVFTNVVDLSKKRCFHGGVGIDNEVICSGYIRRGDVIVENHQKIIGSK